MTNSYIKESPFVAYGGFGGGASGLFYKSGAEVNYSVDFDGSGDYLRLASSADLCPGSDDFTFEAWIYPDSWSTTIFQGIYVNGYDAGVSGALWIGNNPNSGGNFVVRGGGVTDYIQVTYPPVGSWTHVAVARTGGYMRIFFNGAEKKTVANSTNFPTTLTSIGSDGSGSDFNGKISNLRFIKGTALYTNHFAPPTDPLEEVTNTKLLCCNGSSTTASTVTTGTITANGDPTSSTDNPFIFYSNGGYAVSFDGATDGDALTVADFPNFLTNDFTVECYIKPDTTSGGIDTIMDTYQNSSSSGAWWALHQNNDGFYWGRNSANPISTSGNLSSGNWYHVAMVRNGTNFTLYLNGSSIGTYTESYDYTDGGSETRTLSIARQHNPGSGRQFDGTISNVRITIGQALYTSDFTSSIHFSAPFTNSSQGALPDNVKLLCCGQVTTTGSAITPGTITAIGSPSVTSGPYELT